MESTDKKATKFDQTIVKGPILNAVWKMAWPTMLQNMIAGLQGIIDHTLVGHYVGYRGNAAIGMGWQIFLVVIVFMSSLSIGMSVLISQAAGAGDSGRVNKIFYQALLTAVILSCLVIAPLGYFTAPYLLDIVKASELVKIASLPYLRMMFVGNIGLLFFFMMGGALRAAGDAKTPLMLGVVLTVLNLVFNIILIPGLGPIPAFGVQGSAMGTVSASLVMTLIGLFLLFRNRLVIRMPDNLAPDFKIIKTIFSLGLPAGFQGIAMNVAGVILLRFIGMLQNSTEAQAAYVVCYNQLFSLITWTSLGLMSAASIVTGQNLGAKQLDRAKQAVVTTSYVGLGIALTIGTLFILIPSKLLGLFGIADPLVTTIGQQLLTYLSISGLFITVALTYTGGLQGTGDTRSPFYISLISQIFIPIGLCLSIQLFRTLQPQDIWLAIVLGHMFRAVLSFIRFRQGAWLARFKELAVS